MKRTLALGTMLLGCCLAVVAQSTPQGTQSEPPQGSTPSTFPQDQTSTPPANTTSPANPSAMPPDTSATQTRDHSTQETNTASNWQQTASLDGCLSQSSDGNFTLADNSGNSFQLKGDTAQLNSYVGKQIHVDGTAISESSGTAGAMASSTGSSASSGTAGGNHQFSVSTVKKVADSCSSK